MQFSGHRGGGWVGAVDAEHHPRAPLRGLRRVVKRGRPGKKGDETERLGTFICKGTSTEKVQWGREGRCRDKEVRVSSGKGPLCAATYSLLPLRQVLSSPS